MMLGGALQQGLRGVAFSRLLQTPRCRQCLKRNAATARTALDPFEQEKRIAIREPYCILQRWLSMAQHAAPNLQHRVACLATVDAAGQPVTRMTNIEQINASGLTFYTMLGSRVAGEISNNPHISLQFHWPQLRRSVHVSGIGSSVCALQAQLQFARYPHEVQLGLHGIQCQRRSLFMDFLDWFSGQQQQQQEVPVPKNWGGFLLQPSLYEFMQDDIESPGRQCMRFRRCLTLPRGLRDQSLNADRYDWVFDNFIEFDGLETKTCVN